MQDPFRFDTQTVASRELTRSQLATSLVFELQQVAALLEAALVDEESRAAVRDPSDPQYPMLARSLRSRFDNLQKTITSLKAAA
jgi:hypothetical protein